MLCCKCYSRKDVNVMRMHIGIFKAKILRNASWIVAGRVVQMAISFVITMITARYLGPSNYGVINYVDSFVVFFASFSTLGIENVIVKELVHNPDKQGETLGSTIVMQMLSSFLSIFAVVGLICLLNSNDSTYRTVALLYSVSMFFKCLEVTQYWYQAKLMSKTYSIASTLAYIAMSIYRVYLLATSKGIEWFAFSTTIDALFLAVILIICYKRDKGPKLHTSIKRSKDILSQSYHYILSGLMIAIYWQSDKVMLRHIVNETAVGYYSTATKICSLWAFVLVAIIDSARPVLFDISKKDIDAFNKRTTQLYAVIIYISVFMSTLLTIFAPLIIKILYGNEYLPSIQILRIVTWCTTFSYLGMARSIWVLANGLERYEKRMALVGTICNLTLNAVFIPMYGAAGAAIATLITQIVVNYIIMLIVKELRPNGHMITEAFSPKIVMGMIRNYKE